ncbi:type I polyketide synthase [Paracidobacterium acidisoli]|nr:type I polyketide synthase [Paracidobacterium acidisoli]MBT9332217.1 SDR family NAD(P)-dependent oxidoreductase [Paracidobacterium acidisoli]
MRPDSLQRRDTAVAIIGMACRFPGARNVAQYWRNLCEGVESLHLSTDEELRAAGVDASMPDHPDYVRSGGVVEDAESFDAPFFGFGAREAEIIDPQQRVFLECAWEALEDAGYDPEKYAGAVGMFAGAGMNTYAPVNLLSNPETVGTVGLYQLMLGNDKDFLATRAAYKMNLKGPAVSVQTACSTSLVAVQMAFESLLRGECDMAMAGGVSIAFPQKSGYLFMPGMILSPDGHCRAFDAKAAGTVPGRGAGIVVLKRLEDALADRDHIYAVIRGAAINNDGSAKVGYSAPSVEGQSIAIRRSMEMAGFEPASMGYIEAHGTGTEVGDPIEVAALQQAFGNTGSRRQFCAIGSVKTNIGHLDTAAGVAGLIKAALTVRHRTIPPTLHFTAPNPLIPFAQSPFRVNTSLHRYEAETPFRAGVSSFGIGGTNAHVSLEEWQQPDEPRLQRPQLLVWSARSEAALESATQRLAEHLEANPDLCPADVAFTLQSGRRAFRYRRTLTAHDAEDAIRALQETGSPRARTSVVEQAQPDIVFLFPGQGSQYVQMGAGLYRNVPLFAEHVDHCCEILAPLLHLDLRSILYPGAEREEEAAALLNETWVTQPALFTVEYAAARMWQACGIEPAAMLGHSVGEYVAACLAGVMRVEDALRLIAVRGKLIQSMLAGAMLAVSLPEEQTRPLLSDGLCVAAVNAHNQTVASGPAEEIEALEALLKGRHVPCRRLRTSHAFHSAMLDPAVDALTAEAAGVVLHAPRIPYLSNVTGTWVTDEEATSPAYWGRHMRSAVRFADGLDTLRQQGDAVMLEAGPGESLLSLQRQHFGKDAPKHLISTMRHPSAREEDYEHWLDAAGRLWLAGAEMEWSALHAGEAPCRVSLPTYPFERQRYWIEARTAGHEAAATTGALSTDSKQKLSSWFYTPSWKRSLTAVPAEREEQDTEQVWLVLADDTLPALRMLRERLAQKARVIQVRSGKKLLRESAERYTIDLSKREDYAALIQHLLDDGLWPEQILHGWAAEGDSDDGGKSCWDRGLYSAMYLAQAIADVSSTRDAAIHVVTVRGQHVFGERTIDAAAAALATFCKVIPLENANVACKVIDIDPDTVDAAMLAGQLEREVQTEPDGEVIALRHRTRWVEEYEPLATNAPAGNALRIRNGGVYVITGGLGGVGLVLAEHLACTAQARVVLTTRSELPAEARWEEIAAAPETAEALRTRIRALQRIRAAGGEVHLLRAEVNDRQSMAAALDSVRSTLGPIRGVLHAAGLGASSMMQSRSRDEVEKVLAPKTEGCAWIPDLTAGQETDFILLFSSISAVVPGVGLSDYGAANSFLDAFAAAHDREDGTRVLSVNWDRWSETGMAADASYRFASEIRREAMGEGITNREAVEVFDRVLACPQTRIIVSTRDLYRQLAKSAGVHALLREVLTNTSAGAAVNFHPRPALSQEFTEPTEETERAVAIIWQNLLGVDRVGSHDNFFELGGHSLLGIQVMARIRERFGVDLPLRTVFEAPTPAEFAQLIRTIPWASGMAAAGGGEREEIEI